MLHHEQNSLHFPHMHIPLNRELREFYAFLAIRSLGLYMIGIFVPIYLYLYFGRSLALVFLFLAIRYTVFGLFAPIGAKVISKIGIKHTLLLSTPFIFIYYVGLWQIDSLNYAGAFMLAVLSGLASTLYWTAYHIYFTRFSDKGKRGREMGYRSIILHIAAAVSPFIGGFIIAGFGFGVLFIIVLSFLFASIIPLFLSKEAHEEYHDSYRQTFRMFKMKKYRKAVAALVAQGVDTGIEAYAWPLFLFILAINFESLGIIASASFLISMVFVYYIGKKADEVGSEKLLTIGTFLSALFWPIKMFVRTPFDAFLAQTLHSFGRTSIGLPFVALIYEWAGESEKIRDKIIVLRETTLNLSRGMLFFVLSVVFMFTERLEALFVVAAVASFGYLFIIKRPKELTEEVVESLSKQHQELDAA